MLIAYINKDKDNMGTKYQHQSVGVFDHLSISNRFGHDKNENKNRKQSRNILKG